MSLPTRKLRRLVRETQNQIQILTLTPEKFVDIYQMAKVLKVTPGLLRWYISEKKLKTHKAYIRKGAPPINIVLESDAKRFLQWFSSKEKIKKQSKMSGFEKQPDPFLKRTFDVKEVNNMSFISKDNIVWSDKSMNEKEELLVTFKFVELQQLLATQDVRTITDHSKQKIGFCPVSGKNEYDSEEVNL